MDLSHYNQLNLFGADIMLDNFLDPDELCATIQREISPLIKDTDFEDMYEGGGRPPISPRIMLLTLIMQFLERLSDRAAANNLKYRLDWKIAFGLPVDFPGIHNTTLVHFRDRLVENEKASYVFDKVLDHLTSLGLVKKGKKQRIDSTHVIGNVRELSRLELLHETLRLFCKDIFPYKGKLDEVLQNYHELYVEKISTRGITNVQREKYINEAGLAMRTFLEWEKLSSLSKKILELKSYETLEIVFKQNFEDKNPDPENSPKLIKIATGKDHICSPHETDARYSTKGGKGWIGYKVQVAETIGDEINFITYTEATDSTDHDGSIVAPYIKDQDEKGITPSEVYGDTHYNSEHNINCLEEQGINLKGPVAPIPNKEISKTNTGFSYDKEKVKVICPIGVESKKIFFQRNGKTSASFPQNECGKCERSEICQPQKRGKRVQIRFESDTLKNRREEMKTEKYKEDMHHRNGIEGTISGLVRGQGMRRSKYRGKAKALLQNKLIGASANITRLHRYNEIKRKQKVKVISTKLEMHTAS